MILNFIRENKGKSLLIAGIVLMWAILGMLFANYGYYETWDLWNVPSHSPVFRDWLLIPGSAESFRNGFEPTIENPYDVGQRIFNYPAFWRRRYDLDRFDFADLILCLCDVVPAKGHNSRCIIDIAGGLFTCVHVVV